MWLIIAFVSCVITCRGTRPKVMSIKRSRDSSEDGELSDSDSLSFYMKVSVTACF
ncbi:hypothetical protein MTBBW1_1260060 [Desulfamplus magnetovallimortis]|uniref:Uncharacterized protein n=1 Tax=Desulfamplus magnetovallimortis TaxID=1246637 RepID=A0A1W1H6Y4_9BACT|nr:hypothetical protein MTBBW1_1260060 [Desulfamplus magnetovallimortis]